MYVEGIQDTTCRSFVGTFNALAANNRADFDGSSLTWDVHSNDVTETHTVRFTKTGSELTGVDTYTVEYSDGRATTNNAAWSQGSSLFSSA